jgi:glycosyltransferase involved in cell wall biosynthesis
MIYFDITKTAQSRHASGLTRVSRSLLTAFGPRVVPVRWESWDRKVNPNDWYLIAELFSEEDRPGITAFLEAKSCKTAAVFHDLIPLRFPHITWPKSVARHPVYVKLLTHFNSIYCVSNYSKNDLIHFWKWQGITQFPEMHTITLGSDFSSDNRVILSKQPDATSFICVGIIEPRKNQELLLTACKTLWDEGLKFDMHCVGRLNPHYGKPILEKIKRLMRDYSTLHYHDDLTDSQMKDLYETSSASLFPTRAEGCGLPLLESLWSGVPCICSDLPVLKENADAGGCLLIASDDVASWTKKLREIIKDPSRLAYLRTQAHTRALPTWQVTADSLLRSLNTL